MQIKSKACLKFEYLIRNIILFTLIGIPSLTFCQLSFQLQDEMVCEPVTIPNGSYYTITAQVKNIGAAGTYDFELDFDYTWGGFITVVKKECSEYFNTNQVKTLTFDSNDPIDVTAGTYGVFLFVATSACADCGTGGGCYVQVADGLGDNPLYVTVTDEPTCTGWDVDPNYQSVPAAGGSYDAQVTTDEGGCSYNLTFNDAWIDFIGYPGGGYFDYSVEPNLGSARTGTISINNVTDGIYNIVILTINQAAAGGDGPGEPESFSIEDVTSTTMYLNWSAPDDEGAGIDHYDVKNCLTGEIVATPSGSSCTISFLIPNTYYGFQVRTVDEDGNYSTYTDCDYEYTDPSPCELPSGLTETSVTTNSAILQWTDVEPDYNIRYKISGGATWTTTTSTTNSKSIIGLLSNTTYEWQVESNCGADVSGYTSSQYFTTLEVEATITVNNLLCDIPGWQRDNEPIGFYGSIYATTEPPSQSWKLKVYKNGILVWTSPSTTSPIVSFNSPFLGTWNEGDDFKYVAERVSDLTSDEATEHTIIIEEKWNRKNIGLNNNDDIDLKVPIKFDQDNPVNHIRIWRDEEDEYGQEEYVCFTISPTCIPIPDYTIEGIEGNDFPNNKFYISGDGYCHINLNNSNIETVLPGEFSVSTYSSEFDLTSDETFKFNLVKYGQVTFNNSNSKILVIVGGLSNTVEEKLLEFTTPSYYNLAKEENSDEPYSIAAYLEDNSSQNYNIWYIAQSNANYIVRNGYSIGLALEQIESETGCDQIDIITHSKGGLDLRSYLQGINHSFDESDTKSYSIVSPIYGKIKKVLFLGTPHKGSTTAGVALIADIFWEPFEGYYSPGAYDLFEDSPIINSLNGVNMPGTIDYANLAGYSSYMYFGPGFGDYSYYFNANDGPVTIASNNYFTDLYEDENSVKQLYQHGFDCISHFDEHKNSYLSEFDIYHDIFDCTAPGPIGFPTNLDKILAFFDQPGPLGDDEPFFSCDEPTLDPILIDGIGSVLSSASIYVKPIDAETFIQVGITNEYGSFSATLLPTLQYGDSIMILAGGYEDLRFVLDSVAFKNNRIVVPMINSTTPTSRIKLAHVELVDQLPITTNSSVTFKVGGQNVVDYEISYPFNQDSIYIPIIVTDNTFDVVLDTGYNQISIKLCGLEDTIIIKKEIYFIPETIIEEYTNTITLNSDENIKGGKIFVNNQYFLTLTNTSSSFNVFKGTINLEISKFGYIDTTISINSDTVLYASDYLIEFNYSSINDSSTMDFQSNHETQFWKNITMNDASHLSQIRVKQFNGYSDSLGLISKSLNFEIAHLNEEWSNIRFVSGLDQFENLDRDSIYLMRIFDDSIFNKIPFDTLDNIAGYDSIVQKLSFNYINFNEGAAIKESIVIMKKQAPITAAITSFTLNTNDSLTLPISSFFVDPDSISNDLSITISGLSAGLNAVILGDSILIYPDECWSGQGYITLDGTHDWLTRTVTDTINVINTEAPIIYYEPSLTLCEGETITLSTDFTEDIFWSNGETTTSIFVDEPGNYFVGHYGECGLSTSDTLSVFLNISPESEFVFSLDNLTATFTNLSTDAETYLWEFGDGATSTELNAEHTYLIPGSYNVTLTAADSCSTAVFSDSVIIGLPNLVGSIEFDPSIVQYGDSLYVSVSIYNDGESTAKYIGADGELDAFVNRIKISQDSCSFVTASLLGVFYTDSLQPGETITFSDAYYIDDTYAIDTFFILFIPNAAEKVTETTFVDNQICSLPDTLFIVDSTCAYNLPITEAYFSNISSSGSFLLNTLYDCNWVISSFAPWITITSDLSGSGTTEITFEIEENSACATRTGNIEISGQIFEVIQEGTESSYTLSSYSVSFLPSGGDGSLVVNATSDCAYYADCISTWVHFEGGPYTNSTEFEFTVDPNLGGPRSTIVSIADTSFTIIQGPVGIIEIPGGEIKIYPNPVDGLVTIECSALFDISEIFISNSLGQRIDNIKPENLAQCKYSCDLSNVANGNYWINFLIQQELYSYQIVVNH